LGGRRDSAEEKGSGEKSEHDWDSQVGQCEAAAVYRWERSDWLGRCGFELRSNVVTHAATYSDMPDFSIFRTSPISALAAQKNPLGVQLKHERDIAEVWIK
jgi:hypothetical protein